MTRARASRTPRPAGAGGVAARASMHTLDRLCHAAEPARGVVSAAVGAAHGDVGSASAIAVDAHGAARTARSSAARRATGSAGSACAARRSAHTARTRAATRSARSSGSANALPALCRFAAGASPHRATGRRTITRLTAPAVSQTEHERRSKGSSNDDPSMRISRHALPDQGAHTGGANVLPMSAPAAKYEPVVESGKMS